MPPKKSAKAIVGRFVTEGPNIKTGNGTLFSMKDREPEKKIETSKADLRGRGRKPEVAQASVLSHK